DNQVTNSTVFDCDEIFSSESDVSMPTSIVYDRYKSGEGYHVVPPPYTGTFMPPKPNLVFHDALTVDETVLTAFNAPSFVQPTKHVKTPRPSVKPTEHSIPADNLRKDIPKSRGHGNNRNIKEEGIYYEEVFAPVGRIESIRLFLAYASFMGFMVYQMDVKSDLLYGTIEEEVYVCQPLGFEDPDYLDKVYKVVKALYGLHQAPKAWYETLANYLLENGFHRGKIDQTLFIKKQKCDILLVQVYVDDIIFDSTNKDLCKGFEKLIKDKFQMSSMGELTLFLGLQVKQKPDWIFISQDKCVAEILRKFGLTDGKSASTPIDTEKPLLKDSDGEDVDVHTYR
nr:putative ribonuclease H-like domain-containing protein [Tanacetum cinerariifolium]